MAAGFIESLLLSYKDIGVTHLHHLATVLELLLPTQLRGNELECEESELCISEKALVNLVKLVTKHNLNKLDSVVYCVLKRKLSSSKVSGPSLTLTKQNSDLECVNVMEDEFKDVFVSSLNSLTTSLLPSCVEYLRDTQHNLSLVDTNGDYSLDKVDAIFSRLHLSYSANPRAKKLIESSCVFPHDAHVMNSCQLAGPHPLSERQLTKLVQHCVRDPSPSSAPIVRLLFEMSTSSVEYFQSTLLAEVCESLDFLSDGSGVMASLKAKQLHQLEIVLTYLQHKLDVGVVDSEAETVWGANKMLGKRVWCICSAIVDSATESQPPDILVRYVHTDC